MLVFQKILRMYQMNDPISLTRHFVLYYKFMKVDHVMALSDMKHILHSYETKKNFPQTEIALII